MFSQPKCSPNQTAEFCRQFEVLKNAADTILQCRIDSEMLINADKEVLEKISTDAQKARKIIEENLHEFVWQNVWTNVMNFVHLVLVNTLIYVTPIINY